MSESNGTAKGAAVHVLDVRAIWIKEFAAAMSREASTLGWLPTISNIGRFESWEREETLNDPALQVQHFPLQRGFARAPVTWLAREHSRLLERLARHSADVRSSTVVCCSPHYAAVGEAWNGPVVYYVTDFFPAYWNEPQRIRALDRRMCRAADLVCPNSQRIADYLKAEADCPEEKIVLIPNATRAVNVLPEPALHPAPLPQDIADLPRPVAGVIGNLANNIDWMLLEEVIDRTPWLSWAFIGPAEMSVLNARQAEARTSLMARAGKIRFTGPKPYGALRDYARSLDVAILPYHKSEPTYSGSSTRFYEHLATCRPILATRGFEELLHKEPLLKLTSSPDEMVTALEKLNAAGFRDGFEEARWKASRNETWDARALAIKEAISQRYFNA
jgi:glycosyltransferase involved in cell wall biosynthesis